MSWQFKKTRGLLIYPEKFHELGLLNFFNLVSKNIFLSQSFLVKTHGSEPIKYAALLNT